MPDEAQLHSSEQAINKSLLRRVRVLTVSCLALSLFPAGCVAAIAPGYVTYSDAALLLFIFSPLWVSLLTVLLLLWINRQERALGIAMAVGSGGFALGACALAGVIFFFFRGGMFIGNLELPLVCVAGVLGIFGALRGSARAARAALSARDIGSDASAPTPTQGEDAPVAKTLPRKQ